MLNVEQLEEKMLAASMEIILHAGDARDATAQSTDALVNFDFDLARKMLDEAQALIKKAHNIHTDIIQNEEIGGNAGKYTMLFSHAQDTLMTINTELNIAKSYIGVFAALEKRIKGLEELAR